MANVRLLGKVREELKLSVDKNRDPKELLRECLVELEERGFCLILYAEICNVNYLF